MLFFMETVDATTLKNRLGAVLRTAALGPVAIESHGRIVAFLVPAVPAPRPRASGDDRTARPERGWNRRNEERVIDLCVNADFRLSRWLRAGDSRTLSGVAAILASVEGFDRTRMLALAERLSPGMTSPRGFNQWLRGTPVQAGRFVSMLRARIEASQKTSRAASK